MKQEKVLVVPTSCVWKRLAHTPKGLIRDGANNLPPLIDRCGDFIDRAEAERDPAYKQIIPYAVVRYADSFLLLERKTAQSEQRLHNKLSIGVGGHINPPAEGNLTNDLIHYGLKREIAEELHMASEYEARLVGLINDDTTEVGSVHLGVLFEIDSVSRDVRVRERHKMSGSWVRFEQLEDSYERLETWSQIVYDSYLCEQVTINPPNGKVRV